MKGIIGAKGKQRIDLMIEPIKTGDFDLKILWKFFDDFKANPDLYLDVGERVQFNEAEGAKHLFKNR